jgi:cytoskeletal protein RodZ
LEAAESLGAGLRAVREHYQLSLEDVALATCIRRAYLAGIETMRLDQLPSRPFVIGYVRAYATTLGLDPDRAVARFKMEFPDEREPLRAPIGVAREGDRRLRPMLIAGVLVIGAFLAWNIAQHAMSKAAPAATSAGTEVAASSAKVHAPAAQGPISVGAPLPAPQESTLPAPYVTPGLAETGTVAQAGPTLPVGAPFAAHGAVYGAEAGQSLVTLQAVKSASLIVRGADGTVYFARQLAAGEAYRAPQTPGLSVEVSDPAVVDVFVGGAFKSLLPAPKTAVSRLTDPSGG